MRSTGSGTVARTIRMLGVGCDGFRAVITLVSCLRLMPAATTGQPWPADEPNALFEFGLTRGFPKNQKAGGAGGPLLCSFPNSDRQAIVDSEAKSNVSIVGFPVTTGRSALSSCGYVAVSYFRTASALFQTLMASTC